MKPLTPTEHRGYRELHLALGALQEHWGDLSERIHNREVSEVLRFGTHRAGGLMRELKSVTGEYGSYGGPRARRVSRIAGLAQSWLRDPFLDQSQAARAATTHASHLCVLLAYLATAAEQRRDTERARLFRAWENRFDELSAKVRAAVCTMAGESESTLPVHNGPVGRIGEQLASVAGNLIEAADQRRAAPRDQTD